VFGKTGQKRQNGEFRTHKRRKPNRGTETTRRTCLRVAERGKLQSCWGWKENKTRGISDYEGGHFAYESPRPDGGRRRRFDSGGKGSLGQREGRALVGVHTGGLARRSGEERKKSFQEKSGEGGEESNQLTASVARRGSGRESGPYPAGHQGKSKRKKRIQLRCGGPRSLKKKRRRKEGSPGKKKRLTISVR